jgi:hypothetical protein
VPVCEVALLKNIYKWTSQVEVTLRLTVSHSVSRSRCRAPLWDWRPDISSCRNVAVLSLWGALSDDRTGLQFAVQSLNGASRAEPVTKLYCLIRDFPNLEGQVPVFISPRNSVARLYPPALCCLYDSQGSPHMHPPGTGRSVNQCKWTSRVISS